jgi:hypothetical protein
MGRSRTPTERRILCTHCDGTLVVASEAKSVSCRHCNQRVVCEPITVKEYVAVRTFRTANAMHITKKGLVYAAVRAEDLRIEGYLQGEATALGAAVLSRTARVIGNLRARTLVVEEGAVLTGDVAVGPDEVPPDPVE